MSRSFGDRSVTWVSPIEISPAVTSSSPARRRRIVDLPQPDGPTRTMNSPSSISSERSSTATTSSKIFVTPSKTIFAILSSLLPLGPGAEARLRERGSGAAMSLVPRTDLVETQQRRAHHRRDVEHADPGVRGHPVEAVFDALQKVLIAGGEDPPAQDDVHVEPRHVETTDRGAGHPDDLVGLTIDDASSDHVALRRRPEHDRRQLDDPALRDPLEVHGLHQLFRSLEVEVPRHQ